MEFAIHSEFYPQRRILASTIPLRGGHGWGWYYKAKEEQKKVKKPSNIWKNESTSFIASLSFSANEKRTRVFMDIGSENKDTQRVVIELLVGNCVICIIAQDDIVPKTAENFKNLIRGTNGLKYKDCTFFDVRKDEFVCSGAVKGGFCVICLSLLEKRLGGYSSFAKQYFDDENFIAQYPF